MSIVICHTEGCVNQDVAVYMNLATVDPQNGTLEYVGAVSCGPCGQPITDINPPLDPGAPAQ